MEKIGIDTYSKISAKIPVGKWTEKLEWSVIKF